MKISKDTMVSIEYTLKDKDGKVIDASTSGEPLDYLHGYGNLITGLEKELDGHDKGDSISVVIQPSDAYGEYDKTLVISVPKSQFDTDVDIEEGMQFQADSPAGSRIVTVIKVEGDKIVIDANHPLAGETLYFEVKVIGIRQATDDEIASMLSKTSTCSHDCGGGCESCGGSCDCEGDGECDCDNKDSDGEKGSCGSCNCGK